MTRPSAKFLDAFKRAKERGAADKTGLDAAFAHYGFAKNPLRDPSMPELAKMGPDGDQRLRGVLEAVGELEYDAAPWILCVHAPEGSGKSMMANFAAQVLLQDETSDVTLHFVNAERWRSLATWYETLEKTSLSELVITDQVGDFAGGVLESAIESNRRDSRLQMLLFTRTSEYQHVARTFAESSLLMEMESEVSVLRMPTNSTSEWVKHFHARMKETDRGSPLDNKMMRRLAELAQCLPGVITRLTAAMLKRGYFDGVDKLEEEQLEKVIANQGLGLVEELNRDLREGGTTRSIILKRAVQKLGSAERGVTYEDLIRETGLHKSSLRHHLKKLSESEVLIHQRMGKGVVYRLRDSIAPMLEAAMGAYGSPHDE